MTTKQGRRDEQLAAVIIGLPQNLRVVFVMAHVLRQSRREIADALGVSEGRVERRLTKALRMCRERLVRRGVELTRENPPESEPEGPV
jgi:RNA polymerase sigma factor (sigma-70 family)